LNEIYSSKKPINLLIAGKGHEKHQLIGNKYFKFNDKQAVLSALKIL
jgi:UDP-N-acetylmuramyl tripeptide synthase